MESEATATKIQRVDQTRVILRTGETVPEAVFEAAKQVVAFLTDRTGTRLDRFQTLLELARRLGCDVHLGVGCQSSYCADDSSGGEVAAGVITLDVTEPRVFQIRRLAHELTHHILVWNLTPFPPDLHASLERHGPPDMVEERICRAVEDLVLALPSGLQWDGKLGLPRGDGRIRIYRRCGRIPRSAELPADEIDRLLVQEQEG